MLSQEEIRRYGRHIILPEVGLPGQEKLKNSSVLLVGAGGLGSPLALYLASAGVGRLGIVDFDVVDASNLHRQILHTTPDIGRSKLASAKDRLAAVNPNVKVEAHETRLTSKNAMEILRGYDVVVDGTDNYATRYLVNDACALLGKPNVYGSIFRFEGQASVFDAARGPCYRCLYPEPPPAGLVPNCAEAGVLGILPGVIGTIQATETIKLLLGAGESLVGRLLLFDALEMKFRELKLRKNPECPLCSDKRTIRELIDYDQFCGVPAQTEVRKMVTEVEAQELKQRLDRGDAVVLVDVREKHEWELVHLKGAKWIPLRELPARIKELQATDEIVTYCHHGMRSQRAAEILLGAGFGKVANLRGGIDAWSAEIDPSLPRY